jgi:cytidylate kinase
MIITIDGPAGAGKSSVARALARRLHFTFLDTGAMYRAVTLAALRRGLALDDAAAWEELAGHVEIAFDAERVLLDGDDVTDAVRTYEISNLVRHAAGNPGVRAKLVELQRAAAANKDVVTEGRDQGTVAFPHAECKIFLTAGPEERARRRLLDLQARGEKVTFEDVLAKQNSRDDSDRSRSVGPLVAAPDAIEVLTDGLTPEQVVDRLEHLVRRRIHKVPNCED